MKKRLLSLVMALAMICGFAAWVPENVVYAEGRYLWPVPTSRSISTYYSSSHDGLDITAPLNTTIVATKSGTVVAVLDGDVAGKWIGYGKGVVINHGDGYYSHYAHMNYTSVSTGQHVNQGDKLGGMGTTGNSTGVHLHFAVGTSMYGAGGRINNNPEIINYIYSTDSTPPAISNVRVYDADNNGYTVECTVTDEGGSGLDHVQFPTWTLENDQDDIKWTDGTISGSTVTFRVNISDHNYEYGIYRTHIYAYDNAGNYSCTAVPDVSVGVGHEMSEDEAAGQTIPDGNYWIVSELGKNAFLDIYGVEYPAADFTKIIACEVDDDLRNDVFDTWTVTYLNNGFYKITQNGVNVAMEVPYASLSTNSLVKTYEENNSPAQQWSISRTNHGYAIRSRANGYYLDVQGAVTGGNVMTYDGHDGTNQSWSFVPFYSDDRPVKDGEYNIKSAAGNAYLDAEGSSYSGGTNIQVDSTASDTFVLKYIDNGYYTISEKTTGLYLSVADTGDSEYLKVNKNIQLTGYSEPCRNNLWRLVDKGDNQYYLISKYNGYYLDLAEMSTIAGTNVQSVQYNSSDTQKWMFVNPHAHSYTSKVTKKATCTKTGVRTYTCSCGDSYTKTIKALGHDYVETVVKPTCSSKGYTNHKCTRCGNEYNDTETDMIAHKYGKWVETTAPTCTAKGVQTRTCSVCKTKQTKKIAALGHDYIESVIPPTCQTKGYTLHKCSRCKDEYKDNETDKSAHSFGKWKTTTAATCTAKGAEKRTCSVCKASETREIKALGHDYVASIVPATCRSKGYTLYKCSRCNDEFKDNYTDSTGGHKWSGWKTTAFDLDKGTSTQKRTCSVCNKTESKTTKNAVVRLGGANRYETAAVISTKMFKTAETVIIATGMSYHDALVAVPLAKAYNAPLLLATEKKLTVQTKAELERLKAKNVIIVSTANSIGTQTIEALAGYNTSVISGKNCFDTAAKVAKALQEKTKKAPDTIFFATDSAFADALSASPVAAIKGAPIIYLKNTGSLDSSTADYLKSVKGKVKNAYIIGGDGVISDAMMSSVAKALGLTVNKTVQRVAGMNRYETCAAVNNKFKSVLTGDMICVATGMDFPDALAGGVYAALNKAPLFLINGKTKTPKLTDEQKAYLKTKSAGKITAFGGIGVVPDSHIADIAKNSI